VHDAGPILPQASQWYKRRQIHTAPSVQRQACHPQQAMSATDWNHPVQSLCRNKFTRRTTTTGHKIKPVCEMTARMTNLSLPTGPVRGVSDQGIKD
jgi:hypothetical protein